jgi:hypothetical protein
MDLSPWRIAGRYLEACNCDAICPCRMIGGVPGGRSTHGVCYGALAWRVDEGNAGRIELSGSAAVLTYRYSDDEEGSPWTLVLHVDGPDELGEILLGRVGGKHVLSLPWVRKPRKVVATRRTRIEFAGGEVRAGEAVRMRAFVPVPTDETVSCIVPGHDRPGTELYADELFVEDPPFDFELHGTCAFTRDFEYTG